MSRAAGSARPLADGSNYADVDLLNDLLETIDADPSNIGAYQLLAEQYVALGWMEAAVGVAHTIQELSPDDDGALAILLSCGHSFDDTDAEPLAGQSVRRKGKAAASASLSSRSEKKTHSVREESTPTELKGLRDGYQSLRQEAADLLSEIAAFKELAPEYNCASIISDLEAITDGQVFSVSRGTASASKSAVKRPPKKKAATPSRPKTATELAHAMKSAPGKATEVAIEEFKSHPQSNVTPGAKKPPDEVLRDAVRKRAEEVTPLLPNKLAHCASDAFMHIEHEFLGRTYQNDETMLGDSLLEIPRDQFFASEDGYAWDMSELVQALKANGGVMRNPLSKDSFTVADVEGILRHPAGKELAAMQIEQSKLFQGVRQDTVTRLESMAQVLLGDDDQDSRVSRGVVDDFFNYIATLPSTERQAIDKLRVPAKDSHTGQNYDATIGDALRDAKANLLCFHKAGDLCQQAAAYLKRGNGGKSRAW